MNHVRTFVVVPHLPEPLEPLRQLAYNLWWSWNHAARELFRRLDVDLWEQVGHNPVAMLWRIDQHRLEQAARDDAYIVQLHRVMDAFYVYHNSRAWYQDRFPDGRDEVIAYFSAEFGLHEALPIYSGGLGVLAGDHLKAASDLGVPLVAVGLLYRQGYFEQQLTEDGWQLERYPSYDFHTTPAAPIKDGEGKHLRISVAVGKDTLHAQIWCVHVGRINLYLLDADIPENSPELRTVTSRLYGGDQRMRIRQEILLGIGGLRALDAVGIRPTVCHINEGHAAFLVLERLRQAMVENKLSYEEAREAVTAGHIFTTHTPVPAGIDRFEPKLVKEHLSWLAGELGLSVDAFVALGQEERDEPSAAYCMPVLALRMSLASNGVSALHGEVARAMWQGHWPGVPQQEIPIIHVTNGVHVRTWISAQMAEMLDQYLGPTWAEAPAESEVWRRVEEIPDAELWRVHVRRREHLIGMVRRRLRDQLRHRGAPPAEIKTADEVLDPEALTIGFARRFAPYKRANLILRSIERLGRLLKSSDRPIQLIFAGKAHPADGAGKELIKQLSAVCSRPELRRHVVFLENYDMRLARVLVQGVDVWLNNPLRLHEASGTSGMKVVANGGLNLSCLDGWWPEAYNGENGWAIGDGRIQDDPGYQDHVEAESLYNLLEREIVPLFYERAVDDVPRKWLARVKEAIRTICPVFTTIRMLREYSEAMYAPALLRSRRLRDHEFDVARQLATWKRRLRSHWHEVRITNVVADCSDVLKVGDQIPLHAKVHLGPIDPHDVAVEVYHGPVDASGEIATGQALALQHTQKESDGMHGFQGVVSCTSSGRHGFAVRVVPNHADLANRYEQGLIVWG
ncbi:MAG: alpha-glucan family phosphorylase [Phycisphaerae bacterium]|jgi:starch phosphorylase